MITRNASILLLGLMPLAGAVGQTMTNDNFTPQPGSLFPVIFDAYWDPGPEGADQTWNFSALSGTMGTTVVYTNPEASGQTGSFPGSTVASSSVGNGYVFYAGTSSGLELHGTYLESATVYDDPTLLIVYPCSFSTTWTDSFSAINTTNSFPFTLSGTITGEADGFGTLIMPYGTVTNVLRVKQLEEYTEVFTGVGSAQNIVSSYKWVKPGIRFPVLSIDLSEVTFSGELAARDSSSTWLVASAVGIEESMHNPIGVELFPNPASDMVYVTYSTQGGSLQLELMDATGRILRSEGITSPMGIGQHVINVNGLPAGMYQLRITATNGQRGTQRLVVQ